jgi:D-inositol-3-phosphate glycosyltransferase
MFHTLGMMKNRIANEPDENPISLRAFNEADIMSWADRLIAATPAERAQMLWLYRANRRKIEIVPPGVDLTRFRPIASESAKQCIGLAPDHKLMLFVGRIEPLKGVDTIFESMSLIKRDAPHLLEKLSLGIIGGDLDAPADDNREMERLKLLREQLGLDDLIVFLGAKDQDTLNYYYAASEALIMPSDYESFGMVALEAMASGTPVIASEVGGLAYLVQNCVNGYHVPTREPQALADKIRILLEQPDERKRLADNAVSCAQEYAWPRIADRLLKIFDSMIPTRRVASATS